MNYEISIKIDEDKYETEVIDDVKYYKLKRLENNILTITLLTHVSDVRMIYQSVQDCLKAVSPMIDKIKELKIKELDF